MKNEAGVRKWLKNSDPFGGKSLFWCEHRGGGTLGMVDVLVAVDGALYPVELKFGGISAGEGGEEDGRWGVKLRPGQVAVHRRLAKLWVRSFILIGSELGNGVWIVDGGEAVKNIQNGTKMKSERVKDWISLTTALKNGVGGPG
ncbi:MAG: hypothetical protein V3R83_12360 [Gammaproteobacteria bacterium]